MVENKVIKKNIKKHILNNDGEYKLSPFTQIREKKMIVWHLPVMNILQENGVVEKTNHKLFEKLRRMLSKSRLRKKVLGWGCNIYMSSY